MGYNHLPHRIARKKVEQKSRARGVKRAEEIVKEQHRRLARKVVEVEVLCQPERHPEGPMLALRRIPSNFEGAERKHHFVAMRPDERTPKVALPGIGLAKPGAKVVGDGFRRIAIARAVVAQCRAFDAGLQ